MYRNLFQCKNGSVLIEAYHIQNVTCNILNANGYSISRINLKRIKAKTALELWIKSCINPVYYFVYHIAILA